MAKEFRPGSDDEREPNDARVMSVIVEILGEPPHRYQIGCGSNGQTILDLGPDQPCFQFFGQGVGFSFLVVVPMPAVVPRKTLASISAARQNVWRVVAELARGQTLLERVVGSFRRGLQTQFGGSAQVGRPVVSWSGDEDADSGSLGVYFRVDPWTEASLRLAVRAAISFWE